MGKITKLATIVAKAARMEKKAKQFKLNMDDTTITVNDTTDQFTEEEIKQAMAKENPTIYWSDDRNKHWFFDFPFEKDGKRYWISSQNITNDLKNIDIMVFEGNNKGSSHKTKLTKKAEWDDNEYNIRNIQVYFDNLLSSIHSLHGYREDKDDYKYLDLYNKIEKILEEYPEFKIR